MPTNHPTAKQQQVLDFIAEHIQQWGSSPTMDDIAKAIGVNSRGTIKNHLDALEVRGLVTRNANESRSIQLKGAR